MRETVLRMVAVSALVVAFTSSATGPAAAANKRCFGKKATMDPKPTNGTVRGTPGDDVIIMGSGHETIYGLEGDDRICAGRGGENIYGGEGNDRLDGEFSFGLTNISGGPGADFFRRGVARFDGADGVRVDLAEGSAKGHGQDRLAGTIHYVVGSKGDDVLKGSPAADIFYGAGGKDRIMGRKGNDSLTGDHSTGGDRHSRSKGKIDVDTLVGGEGNDTFNAERGDDRFEGQEGRDRALYWEPDFNKRTDLYVNLTRGVARGRGTDRLADIEIVWTQGGDDVLIGDEESNRLIGSFGDDVIRGLGGDDHLNGDLGEDRIQGGPGNDLLEGLLGFDLLFGGAGDDRIDATGFSNYDRDYYYTETDPNELYGGSGNDNLLGNDGADKLYGEEGTDQADGGGGVDDCDAETEVNCP